MMKQNALITWIAKRFVPVFESYAADKDAEVENLNAHLSQSHEDFVELSGAYDALDEERNRLANLLAEAQNLASVGLAKLEQDQNTHLETCGKQHEKIALDLNDANIRIVDLEGEKRILEDQLEMAEADIAKYIDLKNRIEDKYLTLNETIGRRKKKSTKTKTTKTKKVAKSAKK